MYEKERRSVSFLLLALLIRLKKNGGGASLLKDFLPLSIDGKSRPSMLLSSMLVPCGIAPTLLAGDCAFDKHIRRRDRSRTGCAYKASGMKAIIAGFDEFARERLVAGLALLRRRRRRRRRRR
jgi:hypothetical protein